MGTAKRKSIILSTHETYLEELAELIEHLETMDSAYREMLAKAGQSAAGEKQVKEWQTTLDRIAADILDYTKKLQKGRDSLMEAA